VTVADRALATSLVRVTTQTSPAADAAPSARANALGAVKAKGLKYSMVSVVNLVTGQLLLLVCQKVFGFSPTEANVIAVCISAVPAYYLSRRWVWGRSGRSSFKREVLPFWIFVAIGLVVSTVSVKVMHTAWEMRYPVDPQPAVLTNITNIASFGFLWVLRFFLFDRLFHLQHDPLLLVEPDDEDDLADEPA
jgi:putative flippase GtrA